MTAVDVAAAETKALEARARLNNTVEALQSELQPRKLARTARTEVLAGGERAARAGVDVARRNPAIVGGIGALLVAFLARKRIAQVVGKARRKPHLHRTKG